MESAKAYLLFCLLVLWERLAERELPFAVLELMPVPALVVPAILYGSAGAQILQAVVHAVSVLVVNDSVPLELNAVQPGNDEMPLHPKALHIAISVHRPARPR